MATKLPMAHRRTFAMFQGALSARQVDLDKLVASPESPRRLPVAALRAFAETVGGAVRPAIPVRLSLSVDAVTLGGATLQSVGGDLRTDGEAWNLERSSFARPGFTQVRLSGRLEFTPKGPAFTGETKVDSNDPRGSSPGSTAARRHRPAKSSRGRRAAS